MENRMNKTTSAGISGAMQIYYDKKLLLNAKPNLVHQSFGQQAVLPRHGGKSIHFRKWTPFPALTAPLVEGSVPDGQSLEMTTLPAGIEQYGGYVAVSDLLDVTALDPVINDSVELMGDQGGLSIDNVVKDVLSACPNVQYAGNKTGRQQLTPTGPDAALLTVTEIRKAVRTLKRNRAPQFIRNGKGYYVAIVGPDTVYDLQNDQLWQDVSKYAGGEQIFSGEIGKLFGVVFVETGEAITFRPQPLSSARVSLPYQSIANGMVTLSQPLPAEEAAALSGREVVVNGVVRTLLSATTTTVTLKGGNGINASAAGLLSPVGGGADGIPVAGTLVLGKNAYGVIDLEGGNLRTIIKPKGSAGTSDPLDQISTVGWKVDGFAAKILQPLWMVRIEHALSE